MNNPDQKMNSNENKPFEVKIEFDNNIILLTAICTNEIPYNQLVAGIFADQKQLTLSKSFHNLNTKEKLLVIKLDIPVILTTYSGDIDHPLGCVSLNTIV